MVMAQSQDGSLNTEFSAESAVIDFMLKKIRIKLVLAHIDRVLEVLGGVIMVLTFTMY